jgi:hypothetical protein
MTVVYTSYIMLNSSSMNELHQISALLQVKRVCISLDRNLHKRFLPNVRLSKTSSLNYITICQSELPDACISSPSLSQELRVYNPQTLSLNHCRAKSVRNGMRRRLQFCSTAWSKEAASARGPKVLRIGTSSLKIFIPSVKPKDRQKSVSVGMTLY